MKMSGWKTWAAAIVFAVVMAGVGLTSDGPGKGVLHPRPVLRVSGVAGLSYFESGFDAVYHTLYKNLHPPGRFFDRRYAYPSPIFRGVYLWDTAFTSQVWKPWDVATAEEINWTVMKHADAGRLQHFVSPWSSSDYTQPPVMAWSVWENYEWSGDKDGLARAFEVLCAYNAWLYRERRLPSGLFFWKHPYESGIDNSPRFGSADESDYRDTETLAAIDLCSYVVRQNEALAGMARVLGRPERERVFKKQADELRDLVNEKMWDEDTGYYYDLDAKSGGLVKVRTIASLFPLWAGIPDQGRAGRLRDHVMDPQEFNTEIPLPSVARNEACFEKDMWRGPVWVNTAYLVILGMERYGFSEEAAGLWWKLCKGVYKTHRNTGKVVEFYDPDRPDLRELHRKKGNLYKQLTLGGKPRPNFCGWTGLVNTVLVERVAGFSMEGGGPVLAPNFPDRAEGARFAIELPQEDAVLEIEVKGKGRTSGTVTIKGAKTGFDLARGERLYL